MDGKRHGPGTFQFKKVKHKTRRGRKWGLCPVSKHKLCSRRFEGYWEADRPVEGTYWNEWGQEFDADSIIPEPFEYTMKRGQEAVDKQLIASVVEGYEDGMIRQTLLQRLHIQMLHQPECFEVPWSRVILLQEFDRASLQESKSKFQEARRRVTQMGHEVGGEVRGFTLPTWTNSEHDPLCSAQAALDTADFEILS